MPDEVTEEAGLKPSQGEGSPGDTAGDAAPSEMREEASAEAASPKEEPAGKEAPVSPPTSAAEVSEVGSESNLDLILDIPLQLSVELGRTTMLVRDLVRLGQGSIVELTKEVGESVEVLVNDKLIARGEVVVVEDKFGVRLSDIISPSERVEKLR